ncbi:20314_t:CDS:2 [Funneliformis geosporum]|nr:20314_t:CDS:2 [Funneliformis geosporum]
MIENTPASNITWKSIEEAQFKIIRVALHIHYKKDSKLVTEYANYVKILCHEKNPDDLPMVLPDLLRDIATAIDQIELYVNGDRSFDPKNTLKDIRITLTTVYTLCKG